MELPGRAELIGDVATALFAAIGCLTLAASLASLLLVEGRASLIAWIVLLLGFLGAFSYNAPPLSLISTGYGEVVSSIVVAGLVPTFAFALQAGRLERLLLLTLAPLVALHFAMLLAFELPDFGSDAEGGKRTLTVRLGCMTAMRLHDLAIITAAIALVAAIASGVPTRVGLGALRAPKRNLAGVDRLVHPAIAQMNPAKEQMCLGEVRRQVQRVPGQGLVFSDLKTGKSRRAVALGAAVIDVLRKHREQQGAKADLVFCTHVGTPVDARNLREAFVPF